MEESRKKNKKWKGEIISSSLVETHPEFDQS